MMRNHFIPFAIGVVIAYCLVQLWACEPTPVPCETDTQCEAVDGKPI